MKGSTCVGITYMLLFRAIWNPSWLTCFFVLFKLKKSVKSKTKVQEVIRVKILYKTMFLFSFSVSKALQINKWYVTFKIYCVSFDYVFQTLLIFCEPDCHFKFYYFIMGCLQHLKCISGLKCLILFKFEVEVSSYIFLYFIVVFSYIHTLVMVGSTQSLTLWQTFC